MSRKEKRSKYKSLGLHQLLKSKSLHMCRKGTSTSYTQKRAISTFKKNNTLSIKKKNPSNVDDFINSWKRQMGCPPVVYKSTTLTH